MKLRIRLFMVIAERLPRTGVRCYLRKRVYVLCSFFRSLLVILLVAQTDTLYYDLTLWPPLWVNNGVYKVNLSAVLSMQTLGLR